MKLAFALPGGLLAVFMAGSLIASLFGAHPLWREPDPPLNLSEQAALRGQADVVRMLSLGEWDPLESTCRHASLSIL